MKNTIKALTIAATLGASALAIPSARAWWGWGGPFDGFGDGAMSFNMSARASGHGYGHPYYGPYGYGPYAFGPYAYGPMTHAPYGAYGTAPQVAQPRVETPSK